MTKFTERYHYCMDLVVALQNLFGFGKKWDNMAAAFENDKNVREALYDAIGKIQKRLDDILTADDRLRLTTSLTLDRLKKEIHDFSDGSNNELEIIAQFLLLVTYLLGFDWFRGEPNREVIYYQTAEQEAFDDAQRHPNDFYPEGKLEFQKRLEIACSLYDQKLRIVQIARIMRLSQPLIKDILVRAGRIQRNRLTNNT